MKLINSVVDFKLLKPTNCNLIFSQFFIVTNVTGHVTLTDWL